jgi:hypothetical protein
MSNKNTQPKFSNPISPLKATAVASIHKLFDNGLEEAARIHQTYPLLAGIAKLQQERVKTIELIDGIEQERKNKQRK